MSDSETKALLDAEEQAHQLVEQLKRLKDEAESYKEANGALRKVSSDLGKVLNQLTNTASDVGSVIKIMRELGTVEIIDKQDSLLHRIGESSTALEAFINKKTDKILSSQVAAEKQIDAVKASLENHHEKNLDSIFLQFNKLKQLDTSGESAQKLDKLKELVSKTLIFSICGTTLSLIVIGIVVWIASS